MHSRIQALQYIQARHRYNDTLQPHQNGQHGDISQEEAAIHLHSVSHFAYFASVLREVVWTACDRNASKVAEIIDGLYSGFVVAPPFVERHMQDNVVRSRLSVCDPIQEEKGDGEEDEDEDHHHCHQEAGELHNRPFRFPEASPSSEDGDDNDVTHPPMQEQRSVEIVQITFEEFKESTGKHLKDAYESVKQTLGETKERYR